MAQLEYRLDGGQCRLSGELSFDTAAEFESFIASLAEYSEELIVNLAEISYADSAATAFMVELYRQVSLAGGQISFVEVPPHILSVLAMTNLDTILPIAA